MADLIVAVDTARSAQLPGSAPNATAGAGYPRTAEFRMLSVAPGGGDAGSVAARRGMLIELERRAWVSAAVFLCP